MFRFRQIKPQYLHLYEDMNMQEKEITLEDIEKSKLLWEQQKEPE